MRGFIQYLNTMKPRAELNTIKLHVAAFAYHFAISHLPDLTKDPPFKKFIKSIRLERGDLPPNRKSPITGSMIDQIKKNKKRLENIITVRNITMLCLAHAGFLRCSELLNIKKKDVIIDDENQLLKIFIPVSKTDPTAEGVNVFITNSNTPHSAFKWICTYFSILSNFKQIKPEDRIFPISENTLNCIIKRYKNYNGFDGKFSAHSLRRGGAHDAFQQGIPEASIKKHGRWRSSVYMIYTEVERQSAGEMITRKI